MQYKYTDYQNRSYVLTFLEEDPLYFTLEILNEEGFFIHREEVPFFDDTIGWKEYHIRTFLSKEAIKFCEKTIKSIVSLKAFW